MVKAIKRNRAEAKITVLSAPGDNTSRDRPATDIEIVSIKILKSKNLVFRALKELIFAVRISFAVDFDSTFQMYTIPSPIIIFATYFRKKSQYGIDVRDCSWDYIEKRGVIGKLGAILLKAALRPIFRRAKFITCTNQSESSSIQRNFSRDATIIPNGIEEEKYKRLIQIPDKISEPKFSTKILYAGNIGYAQSLMTLVESSKRLGSFRFELVGEGSQKALIWERIRTYGLENVTMSPAVPWQRLIEKYDEADILYAQITEEYASAIPTKIFEYLATGRRVVLGLPEGPARSIFNRFSGVFFHSPGDVAGCEAALISAGNSSPPDRPHNSRLLRRYLRENFEREFSALISGEKKV